MSMAVALPPPAPGFLAAPTWPVSLDWTEEEQRALEAGMQRYPPDRFDCVQRYVKIAAMLPRKSVRDVALRARWTLNQQLLKKRKPGEPLLPLAPGAKKPMPAAGLMAPKGPTLPPVPMMPGMGALPSAAATVPADSPSHAVIAGPVAQLLEANFAILNEFRANMADFRVAENTELLVAFRDNILAVVNAMEGMGGVMAQMPQLPVRLNVDLANNFLPARPASLPRHNLAMPPPQPALNAPGMVPLTADFAGPGAGAVPPPAPAPGGCAPAPGPPPLPDAGGMAFGFGAAANPLIRQEQPVIVKKQEG